jgi:predicted ribosomally synthesized peptide with SipW-like signal peptide
MNKKKVAVLATATALLGVTLVGGTLAYFTDSEDATNVVEMGNVNISLEDTISGTTVAAVPNQKLSGNVSVENVGKNDAFLRVVVKAGEDSTLSLQDIEATLRSSALRTETFATEEESAARVAELQEAGITASVSPTVDSEVNTTRMKYYDATSATRWIYELNDATVNGREVSRWEEKKIKVVANGTSGIYDGEAYNQMQVSHKEIQEDYPNVSYVLHEDDSYWYREEVVETTTYEVTYSVDDAVVGVNDTVWTRVEGEDAIYYYYNGVFATGQQAELLGSLHIPATWGNAYADKSFTLDITAEAVQADYLENDNGETITTPEEAFAVVNPIVSYE